MIQAGLELERPRTQDAGLGAYVPILPTRGAEYDAVLTTASNVRRDMVPVMRIWTRANDPTDRPPGLDDLAGKLRKYLGQESAFFLDFRRIHGDARLGNGQPAIGYVLGHCRRLGLKVVPVISPQRDPNHVKQVAEAVVADGRGACIQLDRDAFIERDSRELAGDLGVAIDRLGVGPDNLDLLLELGYIGEQSRLRARDVIAVINELPHLHRWRTIMLAATSVPSSLTNFRTDGLTLIERQEWALWQSVVTDHRTQRKPVYADYAVQNPERGTAGYSPIANIRYTTPTALMIARGAYRDNDLSKRDQYIKLCMLVKGSRRGFDPEYTAGDRHIDEVSRDATPPGAAAKWRFVGTSHHLRTVADQLREYRT